MLKYTFRKVVVDLMWFKDNYRRYLCDMHIDDWNDEFLSEFSADDCFDNMKQAKIQNAMIYFQSHVGYCYYPTKVGHMHKALRGREDIMKLLVDKCRSNNIAVTGYYSLIYNNWAYDYHPEWRMLDENGVGARDSESKIKICCSNANSNRYGLCCPNNLEYREFVFEQMKEINEYFDFDGMFFDMLFWPHMCYCRSCRERWKKEVGGEIPMPEAKGNEFKLHVRKRREWMGEFANAVTNKMKHLMPQATVEHNFATAVIDDWRPCNDERVNDACDYVGGDLYGGIFEQSFVCKFYKKISKNQPFEYMCSRFNPNLSMHTVSKSVDVMRSSVFLTYAHHGATLIIDAIDPVGTVNTKVGKMIGEVFAEEKPLEKYIKGDMISDVGIYYSLKSIYRDGEISNKHCVVNTLKAMIEGNILSDITGAFDDIFAYKAVIASMLTEDDEFDNNRLEEYVRSGGTLYMSGCNNPRLIQEFFDVDISDETIKNRLYISPKDGYEDLFENYSAKYPIPFDGQINTVKNANNEDVIATLTLPYTGPDCREFASIHSDPPGRKTDIPIVLAKHYGKGYVIWSLVPVESVNIYDYKKLICNLILSGLDRNNLFLSSNAPENVEIIVHNYEEGMYVNAVHLNENHTASMINPFRITVKTGKKPKTIKHIPFGEIIDFTFCDGYVSFDAKPFDIFALYDLRF